MFQVNLPAIYASFKASYAKFYKLQILRISVQEVTPMTSHLQRQKEKPIMPMELHISFLKKDGKRRRTMFSVKKR